MATIDSECYIGFEVCEATMTVTLHLKPEVEAGLLAQAKASGMGLEEYLLSVVESAAGTAKAREVSAVPSREDAVQRMMDFGNLHRLNLGAPITRALLHEGHRF